MIKPRHLVMAAALVLGPSLPALALPPPPPHVCRGQAFAWPAPGATIPANLPGIVFRTTHGNGSALTSIADNQVQLRDGSGALIPIEVGPYEGNGFLIKPLAPLPAGEAVFSFLEDCPAGQVNRLAVPVRIESYRYKVVAAAPLPTNIGVFRARVLSYGFYPERCDRPEYPYIRLQVDPTPELQAFRASMELMIEVRNWSGRLWPELTPGTGPLVADIGFDCRQGDVTPTRPETWTFQLSARLPGAELSVPPLTAEVEVDCTARTPAIGAQACAAATSTVYDPPLPLTDAGAPAIPPDPLPPDGGGGRAGADAGAAQARPGGGGCSLAAAERAPLGGGWMAALLALVIVGRGRQRRRRRVPSGTGDQAGEASARRSARCHPA